MINETLSTALERATRALQDGDAVAASAALEQATLACETALREGLQLQRTELGMLQALHARCGSVAKRAREKIAYALGSGGDARRALSAYRR